MSDDNLTTLAEQLELQAPEQGVRLDALQRERLAVYLSELKRWNGSTNLAGNLSDAELARHALESTLGTYLMPVRYSILDVGSGGGFPGVPLAIAGHTVTLLEPRERRAAFLRHVLRTIPGLNAAVREERVETLPAADFDAATARAVGDLPELVGKGEFLKPAGKLLIWLTDSAGAAEGLAGSFDWAGDFSVPDSGRRRIAVFRRCSTGNTSAPAPHG